MTKLVDVTDQALLNVSSIVTGTTASNLLNSSIESLWQSSSWYQDIITATFSRRINLNTISLLLSAKLDESYTPNHLIIRVGDSPCYMAERFDSPEGWVHLNLTNSKFYSDILEMFQVNSSENQNSDGYNEEDTKRVAECNKSLNNDVIKTLDGFKASVVQIIIAGNEQNGQDCHVRGIKLYASAQV